MLELTTATLLSPIINLHRHGNIEKKVRRINSGLERCLLYERTIWKY